MASGGANDQRHQQPTRLSEHVQRLGITAEPRLEGVGADAEYDGGAPFPQTAIEHGIHQIEIEIEFVIELIIETGVHRVVRRLSMQRPTESNDSSVLEDGDQLDVAVQPQAHLMQELDRNKLHLHRRPVGHLMIQGVNFGSVRSHDLLRIGQDRYLESGIPQLAPGTVDFPAIVVLQRRTVLRKILEHRLEIVRRRRRKSTIAKLQQWLGPAQIAVSELLVNDGIGFGLGRQIADNAIQHREYLWTSGALCEPQSVETCSNWKPADEQLQMPQPRK